jgi:light-regulated signal transduction histidine kinase (bacteriophytochrome)
MQLRFPRTRRAYITSLAAGAGTFLFVILIVHGLLTSMGLRAEATYLDDSLVGIAIFLLVLALEAHHETEVRAERERALLSLGLNHHIRNALQTIVYVSSSVQDEHQAQLLRDAASRIEWAVREVPKQAQADETPGEITAVGWKRPVRAPNDPQNTELPQ